VRIFHQYFRTPETGGSLRSYFLAKELLRNGFEVSIITATNEERARFTIEEGIQVHYLPVYYSNHLRFYSRLRAFSRYVRLAIGKMRELGSADINYVISTPLTTGLIGLYAKAFKKTPYLFEVGDLWPEAPIQLGVLRNPVLRFAARAMERKIYRNAKLLVGLSPAISEHLRYAVPGKEVLTITNFSEPETLRCRASIEEIRNSLALGLDEFVVAYTGTIGLANHLEFLVDMAAAIPSAWKVRVVIMGEGARKEAVKSYLNAKGLQDRVIFIEKGDRSRVACILSIAQAVYISFDTAPALNSGSPNKFFDAIATGKLIIINFRGWLSKLIKDSGIGFSYEPGDPGAGAKKLAAYIDEPERLKQVQTTAKSLSLRYSAKVQMAPLIEVLRNIEKAG